ncbi:cytochrome b5 [Cyberlindnera jadinii NRRL Y-1542]|uniref:Cytochrome b5 n=1 Tax=Cyberlindnera jadinii (strain ATCC 18201 / CBS 1600 / BCRC 20928 / JCM 3617 / NBRC 0987 / NRRL Y-1542) TaxID=983966 RepID=A0A1E4RU30_CYBJN|nr:cytochrome b5 [Cyberlindnera jadinii NRRL Y-1542]ODV70711.1 cytochrome b5 [Cyberlindnera jadinii NRRL Y-1542]
MGKFAPKEPVDLDPPRDDPFTKEELLQYDGVTKPQRYIGIKGVIFDVTKNVAAYGPGTKYSVLVGRDASRALGKSSLKPEDTDITVSSDVSTLTEKQLQVLDDWYSFFSQRYNIVGKVVD